MSSRRRVFKDRISSPMLTPLAAILNQLQTTIHNWKETIPNSKQSQTRVDSASESESVSVTVSDGGDGCAKLHSDSVSTNRPASFKAECELRFRVFLQDFESDSEKANSKDKDEDKASDTQMQLVSAVSSTIEQSSSYSSSPAPSPSSSVHSCCIRSNSSQPFVFGFNEIMRKLEKEVRQLQFKQTQRNLSSSHNGLSADHSHHAGHHQCSFVALLFPSSYLDSLPFMRPILLSAVLHDIALIVTPNWNEIDLQRIFAVSSAALIALKASEKASALLCRLEQQGRAIRPRIPGFPTMQNIAANLAVLHNPAVCHADTHAAHSASAPSSTSHSSCLMSSPADAQISSAAVATPPAHSNCPSTGFSPVADCISVPMKAFEVCMEIGRARKIESERLARTKRKRDRKQAKKNAKRKLQSNTKSTSKTE